MTLRPHIFLSASGAALAAGLLFAPFAGAETAPAPATGPVTLKDHIKPVLEKYCFDCHNDKKQKGVPAASPFAAGQAPPGANPYGKKG